MDTCRVWSGSGRLDSPPFPSLVDVVVGAKNGCRTFALFSRCVPFFDAYCSFEATTVKIPAHWNQIYIKAVVSHLLQLSVSHCVRLPEKHIINILMLDATFETPATCTWYAIHFRHDLQLSANIHPATKFSSTFGLRVHIRLGKICSPFSRIGWRSARIVVSISNRHNSSRIGIHGASTSQHGPGLMFQGRRLWICSMLSLV